MPFLDINEYLDNSFCTHRMEAARFSKPQNSRSILCRRKTCTNGAANRKRGKVRVRKFDGMLEILCDSN
jgi:hypothetical protein